ncbi:hypothetical protein OS493_031242 [Desmophyllum pertusum]|uniref:Uncharacterized protein n=1 Tax=Desmophyllum pertusum TaxID=174260 RepID=A0A9W9Z8T4_9CNID|nr:hypothetical protein OS493_031242 [Desmophyllum pertusum]
MAEAVQWLDGRANVEGNVEKICPKRHIRQNQWQPGWDQLHWQRDYDYISDYECIFNYPINVAGNIDLYGRGIWDNLQADKLERGTNVPITNLAHFTNQENADGIIENGGFRGGMKKINEDEQDCDILAKFSWWSPTFTGEDKKKVRETLGKAIQPFLGHNDDQDSDDQDSDDQDPY